MSLPTRERGLKEWTTRPILTADSSLPTRERGLKELNPAFLIAISLVAPYAGAWIERRRFGQWRPQRPVAPYAGAWIESGCIDARQIWERVAPYAGAWIERKRG